MAKKDSGSKTVLIIVAIIVGILLIGGIIFGAGCYWFYKVGKSTSTTPSPNQSTAGWKNYQNARYSFSLKYPQTFTATEPVNGDGVALTSSSPAISINAYGALNSQGQSLDEYLNVARADLFQGQENAEEISAKDTTLGGVSAQERIWRYISSVDGSQTIMDQVTALKNGNFYTVQMVIANSDYSEYSPMFGQVLSSFSFE